MITSKNASIAFGVTFVLAGLLGFVPNPLLAPDGIFAVNTMHNLVHLLTGAACLVGGLLLPGKERLTIQAVSVAYIGVTILGFLTSGDALLGIVRINEADRWLHLGLALAITTAAFAIPKRATQTV